MGDETFMVDSPYRCEHQEKEIVRKNRSTPAMRKRLNDNKDRVRMFACVYHILKTGSVFYVEEGSLKNSEVKVDYIKSKIINGKGVHLGMRYEEELLAGRT